MRKWPADQTKTVSYSDLIDPVMKAVRSLYKLQLKKPLKDVRYRGYGIGPDAAATSLAPDYALSADALRYADEDQGRKPIETVIHIAFLLGMEQGRRALLGRFAEAELLGPEFILEQETSRPWPSKLKELLTRPRP